MNIKLLPFTNRDFNQLISWVDTEELLVQFAGDRLFHFPLTSDQLEKYLLDTNRTVFKVVDTDSEQELGHAEIAIKPGNTGHLCRILIGEECYRGRGIGEQIIRELIDFGKNDLGLSRFSLNVYDWNVGAIKCYEKCGFVSSPDDFSVSNVDGKDWKAIKMTYGSN